MTREQKYPNTKTFTFFNANPNGRLTSDCVVRAVATATGQTWQETLSGLNDICLATGYMLNDKKCIEKYLEKLGWRKRQQPKKYDGTKYTGSDFCLELAHSKQNYICNIGGHHMVAIVDKKVLDTWNSTGGCIGNYWTK